MSRLEPELERLVLVLADALRRRGVRFCLIGALVPELLLSQRPYRRTNDADAVVLVSSLAAYENLKRDLETDGFKPTTIVHRLEHVDGGRVDLLPYDERLVVDGRLRLSAEEQLNMTGFERLADAAVEVDMGGEVVPVAPLPLYALLKLVTYTDRHLLKDPASLLHVMRHYAGDDERQYGLEHDGALVPYEYASAFLLGTDACTFVDERLRSVVAPVLSQLVDPDSPLLSSAVREAGGSPEDDIAREDAAASFRWFRVGAGL